MGRIFAGFLAGVLAVLVFHQPMGILLAKAGLLPTFAPYNMAAHATANPAVAAFFNSVGFAGWPVIFNACFWGGVWGIVFALLYGIIPGGNAIVKGLVFGFLLILISNWIVLPYIQTWRGIPNQVYFAGFNPQRMAIGLAFQLAFGLGLAIFYRMLRRA